MSKSNSFSINSATGASVLSLAAGLLFAVAPACAQAPGDQSNPVSVVPTGSATGPAETTGEIVVTGSRIRRTDLETAAPLAVVTATEFKQSGAVNVESVLNTLPQVIPGITAFSNNPGGGVATLNLRNLDSRRSLVLVNGRRYMFFDTTQRVDLNTIPQFLVGGVDVVTGGASAVYGSDAIAGVVNFRLRNDVQGFEVGAQYSLTERGDGRRYDAHIAMGTEIADGRGHITTYAEYYKRAPIYQAARAFSRQTRIDDGSGGFIVGGSNTNTPAGRFTVSAANGGQGVFASSLGATFDRPGGAARAYNSATDGYDFAPANYLMVPQERWLLGGYGEYEINEHATAYSEVSYVNNRVNSSLAPTPFTGLYLFDLNAIAGRGYLTAADTATLQAISAAQVLRGYTFTGANGLQYKVGANQVGISINKRAQDVGARANNDDRNAFRVMAGLKGDLFAGFSYDGYYSYARTKNSSFQSGNLSKNAVQRSLLDGSLDLFGVGATSAAAITAISIIAQNQDISVLQVANGSVQGKLFNFGMGADDVGIALGGEYRSMNSQFIPDTALSSGDVVGFNASKATKGGYHVKEAFGELSVPVIANKPFISKLEFNGAARYSDYSLPAVGGVWTYAVGAQFAPVKDITFRGQYSRAVRAPNVNELFGGAGQDFPTATDPCAAKANAGNTALTALCLATGVPNAALLYQGTPSTLQPNTQLQGITGGNALLEEERSTSYTYGVVFRPSFIPRFNVSLDYFNIKVKGAIGTAGGSVPNILSLCYNTIKNASSPICQLIHRNSATGAIDGTTGANGVQNVVFETQANLGFLATSGVDLAADYTMPLDFGFGGAGQSKLNIYFLGTYTKKDDTQPIAGLTTIKCAGRFGLNCGDPHPKYKLSTRLTYAEGPVTTTIKWTHLSTVRDDDDTTTYTVERIKRYDLFSLAIGLDLTDKYSMTFGVNNLFDKKPPIVGSNTSLGANTFLNTYDGLGRDFFMSVNARF